MTGEEIQAELSKEFNKTTYGVATGGMVPWTALPAEVQEAYNRTAATLVANITTGAIIINKPIALNKPSSAIDSLFLSLVEELTQDMRQKVYEFLYSSCGCRIYSQ